MSDTYITHYNGARPYKATVKNGSIDVFASTYVYDDEEEEEYLRDEDYPYEEEIFTMEDVKIFVGKSPRNEMTEFIGGYGPEYDGNSLLIQTNPTKYIFVGPYIYEFSLSDEFIVDYISHVGNNDVPYPYAVSNKERYFLMVEDVVVWNVPEKYNDDPYTYYYNNEPKSSSRIPKKKMIHEEL